MATWAAGVSFRGSKIYVGTGTPTDSSVSAFPGDGFFATDTGSFWVRGSSGWPSSGTSLVGPMGLNGVSGNLYTGTGSPSSSLGTSGNSLYISTSGEVWTRQNGANWVDSGENLTGPASTTPGPQGPQGSPGIRGGQLYNGSGPPSSNLSSFTPTAAPGDYYLDTTNQIFYVLGN